MATIKNIKIDQGADHVEIFNIEVLTNPTEAFHAVDNPYIPLDLTGFTARMMVRKDYDTASYVLSLTDGNGISLGGATGQVIVTITAAASTAITFAGDEVRYVYDLELVDGSAIMRPVQGYFVINREVTR